MPTIKHIKKIEKKVKPGKTVIKFQGEEFPVEKAEIIDDDIPIGGVEVAAKSRGGLSKEWRPASELVKSGDDTITTPDGQEFSSEKDFLDYHARLHGKRE